MTETKLTLHNILYTEGLTASKEDEYLKKNFCGIVIDTMEQLLILARAEKNGKNPNLSPKILYFTGEFQDPPICLMSFRILVVKERSNVNKCLISNGFAELIDKGEVPINFFGVGVFFPRFFNKNDYFKAIESEHKFQELTESTKPSMALRKGIYLTSVHQKENGDLGFRLLRCSSNFKGPTDNFRAVDLQIVNKANDILSYVFDQPATLNHVLAQIYYNVREEDSNSERKATIKAHSDKTKDMPSNGLMAFTTFYDMESIVDKNRLGPQNEYDIVYQGKMSILTQLEFVLKDPIKYPTLEPKFRVTLYPNSMFVISLETNRLYTHEIKPSPLPMDKLPIRLGYVIRCSMRDAVHSGGQTYIVEKDGTRNRLEPMNKQDMMDIKELYRQENGNTEKVEYRPIYTSLNNGDYLAPLY